MNEFFLVTWEQFENRKLIRKEEIVRSENIESSLTRLMELNAQKRLTTTNYEYSNLSELFANNALKIVEDVKVEKPKVNIAIPELKE